MANYYVQTLVSVTTNAEKTAIEKFKVHVTDGTDPAEDIVLADLTLANSGGTLTSTTQWTLDTTDAANGNYEITFTSGNEQATTEYIISSISKSGNLSDRLFVDFAQTFDSSGEATINYSITSPGGYKAIIDMADDVTLNKASASTYYFNNPPDATNSTIIINTTGFTKPYLAQVLSGGTLSVPMLVTLKDASDVALQGDCEISIYADLQ
ncbi:hypothetical protein ACER0A_008760 [Haloimpatiens sp. FM7315]|uniref:hypothetical protein n=1 Tax=Haloimpatiens sp. FM7315 TaxID=3298609 RepID=UPI0035A2EA70